MRLRWLRNPVKCLEATLQRCWRPWDLSDLWLGDDLISSFFHGFHGTIFASIGQVLGGATDFGGEHWDDPVVKPAVVAQQGQIVWDPNPPRRL